MRFHVVAKQTATYQILTASREGEGARKSRDFLMRRPMQAQLNPSVVPNRDWHQSRHTTETYCCLLTAGDASGEARHIPRHDGAPERKTADFFLPTSPRTEPHVELTRTPYESRNYIALKLCNRYRSVSEIEAMFFDRHRHVGGGESRHVHEIAHRRDDARITGA